MRGGGATAAAHHVEETGVRPFAQLRGEGFRGLGEAGFGKRVGQAGVGIEAGVGGGDAHELFDEGAHFLRAERAVQPDGERVDVGDRVPEGLDRLPGEGAAGAVGDGAGDHHGDLVAGRLERVFDGRQGRLGVERVEDGFDQQHVHAAFQKGVNLSAVVELELVEAHGAEPGVVDVGGKRGGHRHRPDGPGDELLCSGGDGYARGLLAGEAGGDQVHLACNATQEGIVHDLVEECLVLAAGGMLLKQEVVLPDRGRAEGVGFNDVGPGLEILAVNLRDHLRPREQQDLVVALEVLARPVGETFAAKRGFVQPVALHHGAHRPVENDDALLNQLNEGVGVGRHGFSGLMIHSFIRMNGLSKQKSRVLPGASAPQTQGAAWGFCSTGRIRRVTSPLMIS